MKKFFYVVIAAVTAIGLCACKTDSVLQESGITEAVTEATSAIEKSETVSVTENEALIEVETSQEIYETEILKNNYPETYAADLPSILGTWYNVFAPDDYMTFDIDGSRTFHNGITDKTDIDLYTIDNGLVTLISDKTSYAAAVIYKGNLIIRGIEYSSSEVFTPYENSQNVDDYFQKFDVKGGVHTPQIYSRKKSTPAKLEDINGKWVCFDWDKYGKISVIGIMIFEKNSVTVIDNSMSIGKKMYTYTSDFFLKDGVLSYKSGEAGRNGFSNGDILYLADLTTLYSKHWATILSSSNDRDYTSILKKCSNTILTKDMLEGAVGADNTEYYESFFKDGKYYSILRGNNSSENMIADYYIDGDIITFCPESETERLYPDLTCKYCVFDEYVYAWSSNTYFIIKLKG